MSEYTTIYRSPKGSDNPFTMIDRETLQDRSLSWEARGVLAYLLSKPNDWELRPKDLEQECGRDKVYRILKELIQARYLVREEVRDEKNIIRKYWYIVYETPWVTAS